MHCRSDATVTGTQIQVRSGKRHRASQASLSRWAGVAIRFDADNSQLELKVADDEALNASDFTIEAFFQVRSVDEGSTVRIIGGKWDGDRTKPGWGIGITVKGSRRKPQTLALQIVGLTRIGEIAEEAVFFRPTDQFEHSFFCRRCSSLGHGNKSRFGKRNIRVNKLFGDCPKEHGVNTADKHVTGSP